MPSHDIEFFLKLLQVSLLPVVMISAASLLLLSITNRLGRTVDRSRGIAREIGENPEAIGDAGKEQLRILVKRSEILRASVLLISVSVFFSSSMVVGLFVLAFFGWKIESIVVGFFLLSILALISSLVFFMIDVYAALRALKLDVARYLE